MMRLKSKTRAGISLALGILAGLGLVTLPVVIAPSAQTSTSLGSNSRAPTVQSMQSGGQTSQPTGASVGTAVGSLLILVSLILVPAIALSFLARYLTLKQAKDRLSSKN